MNLVEKQSKGTHWISLFIDRNTTIDFDSFRFEHILQEVWNKSQRQVNHSQHIRIHSDNFIMCGLYCIAFVKYMIAGKTLLEYMNLFSPNDYEKNDKIIY